MRASECTDTTSGLSAVNPAAPSSDVASRQACGACLCVRRPLVPSLGHPVTAGFVGQASEIFFLSLVLFMEYSVGWNTYSIISIPE